VESFAEHQRALGTYLDWDSLVVAQWDTLILDSVDNAFGHVEADQIAISGLRPVGEVEKWWPWVREDGGEHHVHTRFLKEMPKHARREVRPYCCLFIVAVLPKSFLSAYACIESGESGFLENKIPTYAAAWNIPLGSCKGFSPWWAADPNAESVPEDQRVLNAVGQEIPYERIHRNMSNANGMRIFHPHRKIFPIASIR